MAHVSQMEARRLPGRSGEGYLFGVPLGDLGWFTSLLMSYGGGVCGVLRGDLLRDLRHSDLQHGDAPCGGLCVDATSGSGCRWGWWCWWWRSGIWGRCGCGGSFARPDHRQFAECGETIAAALIVSRSFCYSSFLAPNSLEDHHVCHSFALLCVGAVVRPQSQALPFRLFR